MYELGHFFEQTRHKHDPNTRIATLSPTPPATPKSDLPCINTTTQLASPIPKQETGERQDQTLASIAQCLLVPRSDTKKKKEKKKETRSNSLFCQKGCFFCFILFSEVKLCLGPFIYVTNMLAWGEQIGSLVFVVNRPS